MHLGRTGEAYFVMLDDTAGKLSLSLLCPRSAKQILCLQALSEQSEAVFRSCQGGVLTRNELHQSIP